MHVYYVMHIYAESVLCASGGGKRRKAIIQFSTHKEYCILRKDSTITRLHASGYHLSDQYTSLLLILQFG